MASEFTRINDEDILRKMWQETDDFGRKKEIRAHMYKLREERLKEFYVNEMETKAPISSRHQSSMADHCFESLKSKEIRGTDSPMREIKFGPVVGNTGGWNVISSSETSADGKAHIEQNFATTVGVTAIDGGEKTFSGKNEELKIERIDGNDFTYSTGESSTMHMNEDVVTGDDCNRITEKKSSKVFNSSNSTKSSTISRDLFEQSSEAHQKQIKDQNFKNVSQKTDRNILVSEERKLSQDPAIVKEAFRLAQQPGNIISRNVEQANATTNMITEKKQLADGTIVTTKRFENLNSDDADPYETSKNINTSHSPSQTKDEEVLKKEGIERVSEMQCLQQEKKHFLNETEGIKTLRYEEALRLSENPGKIIFREITMKDPSTRMITEKKELTDGTVVTIRKYENLRDSSKSFIDEQNLGFGQKVRKVSVSTSNKFEDSKNSVTSAANIEEVKVLNPKLAENIKTYSDTFTSNKKLTKYDSDTFNDLTGNDVQQEVLEEKISKKKYDTSCACPQKHDKKMNSRDDKHEKRESDDHSGSQTSETKNSKHFLETSQKIVDLKKIEESKFEKNQITKKETTKLTHELEVDAAHKAFASSLRCVTPPNEKEHNFHLVKKDDRSQRSQSRDSSYKTPRERRKSSNIKVISDSQKSALNIDSTKSTAMSPQKASSSSAPNKFDSKNHEKNSIKLKETSSHANPASQKSNTNVIGKLGKSESKQNKIQVTRNSEVKKNSTFKNCSDDNSVSTHKISLYSASFNEPITKKAMKVTDILVKKSGSQNYPEPPKLVIKEQKNFKTDQTVDFKSVSATTSVSDLEYVVPIDRSMVTDLDHEDMIEVHVDDNKLKETRDSKNEIIETGGDITKKFENIDGNYSNLKNDHKLFHRSETFEERARKLIGVDSDDISPHYAKPTYASYPSKSEARNSEIRERKAKIEKESHDIFKNSIKNEAGEFIRNEKNENRQYLSPAQSPVRNNSEKKSKKIQNRLGNEGTNIIEINSTTDNCSTVNTEQSNSTIITKKNDNTAKSSNIAVAKFPATHITVAKINISPVQKTFKSPKLSEVKIKTESNIQLLKKNNIDASSTEPDSELEILDQDLIKNIDKATGKSNRKKLAQGRKDSAPVKQSVQSNAKVSRSVSDSSFKLSEESSKKDNKRPNKCLATKTVNLINVSTNSNIDTLETVTLDVRQSKSSREPSPCKLVPVPVRTEAIIDVNNVIYPNKITEPEEKSCSKMKNIPIFDEKTQHFVGVEITEIATEKNEIILEEEDNEENNILIRSETLEQADKKRNSIQIDPLEEEIDNETNCMNLSQKVSSRAAEKLKNPKASDDVTLNDASEPEDDAMLSVNRKVAMFTTITDESLLRRKLNKTKEMFDISDELIDEKLRDDECLMSVSDKVDKFINSAEKLVSTTLQKSPALVKNIMKNTKESKAKDVNDMFLDKEKKTTYETEDFSDNKLSHKSCVSDITLKSTEAVKKARAVFENQTACHDIKRHEDIISRPSIWESRLTSTVDKKSKEYKTNGKNVVDRVTKKVHERSKGKNDDDDSLSAVKNDNHFYSPRDSYSRRSSDRTTPIYMQDQVLNKKDLFEKRISSAKIDADRKIEKSPSPQTTFENHKTSTLQTSTIQSESEEIKNNVTRKFSADKHYMSHTVASLEHVNSEKRELEINRTFRRDSHSRSSSRSPTKFHRNISESTNDSMSLETTKTSQKFANEAKRADSGKIIQQPRRISFNALSNVEDIFDLDELERLLEVVVGYEQRRKIRAQIRIVRKSIATETSKPNKIVREELNQVRNSSAEDKSEKKLRDETRTKKTIAATSTVSSRPLSIGADKPMEIMNGRNPKITSEKISTRGVIDILNKNCIKDKKLETVVKIDKKTKSIGNIKRTHNSSEIKEDIDYVTSSYGVGPTDSNGNPLFGLKALKKKTPESSNKAIESIKSETSFSGNIEPTKDDRKPSKYSTDPSGFSDKINSDFRTSTIERNNSRGGIYSITKIEKFEDGFKSTNASKLIRKVSVPGTKDKLDQNNPVIKASNNEKKSSKQHSFQKETEQQNILKGIKSETFSNCRKKASDVKEVISYMKNADNVRKPGDSVDDTEARALLNKFIGANALMSVIESNSGQSKEFLPTGKSSKNFNISTSSKVIKSVVSQSSEKLSNISDIEDKDLLKNLLEVSTSYEERRNIRARLRQVMADKEVCTEQVSNLTAELDKVETVNDPTSYKSESLKEKEQEEKESQLLLPLIQDLLQNSKHNTITAQQLLSSSLSKTIAQKSISQAKMNSEHPLLNENNCIENDCLSIEDPANTIQDSGTESGEDLRLLAAAIADHQKQNEEQPVQSGSGKNNMDALGTGLVSEVTSALARLQNSLNQGEIEIENSKKTALLSLVERLQRGLIYPEKIRDESVDTDAGIINNVQSPISFSPGGSERRGSGGGVNRFAKRRNRVNRHTVGVTREELADARRIIEELESISIQNSNSISKPKITATVVSQQPGVYNAILTRQFSEPITLLRPSQFVPKETMQQIEMPNKTKYKVLLKQSVSLDQPPSILKNLSKTENTGIVEDGRYVPTRKYGLQRNTSGTKFPINSHNDTATDESSSSDDENEIVNGKHNIKSSTKFKAKEMYLRNQEIAERSFNYSSGDEASQPGPRQTKYMSKKMKMKRANTVDLPKSFSFVNTFDLSDKDCSDGESESVKSSFENRNITNTGLKTTITGGSGSSKLPPQFTPKTENDKKFLEFIKKQNVNVTPSYINPKLDRSSPKTQNWSNKFGNLKHKFQSDENEPPATPPPKTAENKAASFWKNIEKVKPSAKVSPLPPSQPLIKNLPLVSEKFPWKNNAFEKISKFEEPDKKKFIDKFEAKRLPQSEVSYNSCELNKIPISKPSLVNNFSHAPMSAFKPPISRKLSNSFKPIQTTGEVKKSMPQISNGIVKQLAENGYVNNTNLTLSLPRKVTNSPTRSIADSSFVKVAKPVEKVEIVQPVPWAAKPKTDRVLSLAASKFENTPTVHLATHLQDLPPESVKYRNNPLYSGTFEKRSSLPPNAVYASFDSSSSSQLSHGLGNIAATSLNNVNSSLKETTFVITDFTQPTHISTYAPEKPSRPSYDRQDSLTNPEQEPLVLTCNRTVYSPREKPKPVELFDISTPKSSTISNGHSISSIVDDLDHELNSLGETVEFKAPVSRVMVGPVAQTATKSTSELTNLNEQNKENSIVKSLQDSLKKLTQKSPTPEKRYEKKILSQESSSSSIDLKLSSSPIIKMASLSQDSSNSSIDKLPPMKIPVPAIPETSYSITYGSPPRINIKSPSIDNHVLYNNVSPALQRTRSSNMLSIPKPTDPAVSTQGMYGASPALVAEKQKTMQSYFAPQRAESLRTKTKAPLHIRPVTFSASHAPASPMFRKISMQNKPFIQQSLSSSLTRSKTMPSIANIELLDESNIDDAFEELLSNTNL